MSFDRFEHELAPHTFDDVRGWVRLSMTVPLAASQLPPAFQLGVLAGLGDALEQFEADGRITEAHRVGVFRILQGWVLGLPGLRRHPSFRVSGSPAVSSSVAQ